jgi:hypothetical protein
MRNGKCKDLKRERKSVLAALCNSEKYRDGGEKIKQAKFKKKTQYLIPGSDRARQTLSDRLASVTSVLQRC